MMLTEMIEQAEMSKEDWNDGYDILRNWIVLSKYMSGLKSPDSILDLLRIECETRRRADIVMRLHARYTSLRRTDEREELVQYLAGKRK